MLPIVTRADTLTAAQRTTVREAIRRDLEAVGLGWGGFDMVDRGKVPDGSVLLGEDSEEDEIGSREGNGSSGDLVESEKIDAPRQTTGVLPFFLFSPEASSGDGLDSKAEVPLKTSFSRTYPWCGIDALNPGHSDFAKLYSNMLGPLLMVRIDINTFGNRPVNSGSAHSPSRTTLGTTFTSNIERNDFLLIDRLRLQMLSSVYWFLGYSWYERHNCTGWVIHDDLKLSVGFTWREAAEGSIPSAAPSLA